MNVISRIQLLRNIRFPRSCCGGDKNCTRCVYSDINSLWLHITLPSRYPVSRWRGCLLFTKMGITRTAQCRYVMQRPVCNLSLPFEFRVCAVSALRDFSRFRKRCCDKFYSQWGSALMLKFGGTMYETSQAHESCCGNLLTSIHNMYSMYEVALRWRLSKDKKWSWAWYEETS